MTPRQDGSIIVKVKVVPMERPPPLHSLLRAADPLRSLSSNLPPQDSSSDLSLKTVSAAHSTPDPSPSPVSFPAFANAPAFPYAASVPKAKRRTRSTASPADQIAMNALDNLKEQVRINVSTEIVQTERHSRRRLSQIRSTERFQVRELNQTRKPQPGTRSVLVYVF